MTGTMTGKTVLVTGASDGIGAEVAKHLATQGATVHVTGRSADKLAPIAAAVGTEPLVADFARFEDVRRLGAQVAERVDHLDLLMNNAGGMFAPSLRTHDGHEPNLQINHLSPFLLTHLLRPQLAAAGSPFVVNTSSVANRFGTVVVDDLDYENRRAIGMRAYGTGKLMNILFTRGITRRWAEDSIVSTAVHPGAVASGFGRDSWLVGMVYRTPLKRFGTITVTEGAAPLIALAEAGPNSGVNGVYFDRFEANGSENSQAGDAALGDALWEKSAQLVGI